MCAIDGRRSVGSEVPTEYENRYKGSGVTENVLRRRGPGRGRPASGVSPGDKRRGYEIAVPLTAEQKRKVEHRAREEVRSVSSYVALLIVAALGRPTTFA